MPSARLVRRLRSPVDIGFFIGGLALVLVGALALRSTSRERIDRRWIEHTYAVLRDIDQLNTHTRELGQADSARLLIANDLFRLRTLTADNPSQQARLDTIMGVLPGDPVAARLYIQHLGAAEQRLLVERSQRGEASARWTTAAIILSTVLAVGLMGVALARIHGDLRRRQAAEMARAESEANYRMLVEQAADAILTVNDQAVCVEANDRAADLIGRPKREIPGLPLRAFVRGERQDGTSVLPMLRFGHVTKGEFWIARPDGSRVAVEIHATILVDGRIQIIARDISERKEIDRLKNEFVSVVSHELRTPLTSIRGALGLLASGRLDGTPEKRTRMLELATSNTDRLIRLINDILDVERIDSSGITFERVECDARALVEQVIEVMTPAAERAGVALHWSADDVKIWADADRMSQTLVNLLDNAIKFSPAGSVVDVTVTRERQAARFTVRDRGRGIPKEKRDIVFRRFQQLDASDAREKGGSGLGLAIARSIVEQHGGRIWIAADVSPGTAFNFTVPLFIDSAMVRAEPGVPFVLACDDDADLLEVLCATLEERGYRALGSRRGHEAIQRFDALGASLVIVDIKLPDINGMRIVRHVHATSPETKIIVYTAMYLEAAERDFIKSTGAVIVTKAQITPAQLVDEVAQLVGPGKITTSASE